MDEQPPSAATARAWTAFDTAGETTLVRRHGKAVLMFSIGPATGDVDKARRLGRLIAALSGRIDHLSWCRQIHGSIVLNADAVSGPVARLGDGDGLIATRPRTGVAVWTADCVPVLIAGAGVVASVHAGWRGCAADVLGAALNEIRSAVGIGPDRLRIALGPAVCGRCYTVGRDVLDALAGYDLDPTLWRAGDRVDLRGFLAARAAALGVLEDRIETVGGCTVESPALASYRRDGDAAGRQWAMAFLDGRT